MLVVECAPHQCVAQRVSELLQLRFLGIALGIVNLIEGVELASRHRFVGMQFARGTRRLQVNIEFSLVVVQTQISTNWFAKHGDKSRQTPSYDRHGIENGTGHST